MSRHRFKWVRRLPMPHTPPQSVVTVSHYNLRARVSPIVGAVASKRFVLRRD